MRFSLGNDVFTVFSSQMNQNQNSSDKKGNNRKTKDSEKKLNFAEMLSNESVRIAAGGV